MAHLLVKMTKLELVKIRSIYKMLFSSFVKNLFWLFFLGIGIQSNNSTGNINHILFMLPGIMVYNALSTSLILINQVSIEKRQGLFRLYYLSNFSLMKLITLKVMLYGIISSLGAVLLILLAMLLIGETPFHVFLALPIIFLISVTLSLTLLQLLLHSKDHQYYHSLINFLLLPLFFLSGTIFNISGLPLWLKTFALLNPLYYLVDLLRGICISIYHVPIILNMFALFIVLVILFVSTAMNTSKLYILRG
ncbi:ABC transporter permease [Brevibacillus sp. SIMBA_040]|uniref:ABC transporter permease n=2 Tax=unclassified Brevibacillus TaxID=2684853 RepID=UPI0039792DB8